MAADAALNQRSATTSPAADWGGAVAAGAAAAAVAELSRDEQLLMIKQRMSRWRALELEVGGAWKCGAVVSVHWRVGLGF